MKSLSFLKRPDILFGSLLCLVFASLVYAQPADQRLPKPRELNKDEQLDLTKNLGADFQQEIGKEVQFQAAGPFRFVDTPRFHYMDRTDTGSVAFENPRYGVAVKALEPAAVSKEVLLPRVEASLRKAGLNAEGMRFSRFQDEFAAAAQPSTLPPDFDPRKAGIHVARTAVYERNIKGVPVFGSELIVGLMPEGDIGRLRLHWPKIDPKEVKAAQKLQKAVRTRTWKMPQALRRKDTKILEVSAGVGHSGFADPGLKTAAVVRVLYRTKSPDREYPLQTTGYKYFDETGKEISFHAFPRLRGTPQESKPAIETTKPTTEMGK